MSKNDNLRAGSLDALRGFAIVMMVLCSAIIMWVLPAWMSHCQEPPPTGAFDPSIYGITWVDLVFPFFLFSMGAAFPFSIGGKIERGKPLTAIVWTVILRAAKLAFFAIFLQHVYPWASSCPDMTVKCLIVLAAFALLFMMFTRFPSVKNRWLGIGIQIAGYIGGTALMLWSNSYSGRSFSLFESNIIILVLANMALFGMILYIATAHSPKTRLAVMALMMGFFLSAVFGSDGWQKDVMEWTPLPWFFRAGYLRYLFIVVPGIYAGEYLRQWLKSDGHEPRNGNHPAGIAATLILCIAIIVINLWGLFTRHLVANLAVSSAVIGATAVTARMSGHWRPLFLKLTNAGAFLLLLGLMIEAFQGGIRKDDPTFSYYFVTSGLAFYCLTALYILCDIYRLNKLTAPLTMAGKNPMIAYVAVSLLIMPVLDLIGIGSNYTGFWASDPWLGLARGVILTILATAVAMFFTKIKWFWRT